MQAKDLEFNEIEGEAPPEFHCTCCGEHGVKLAAEIPLADQSGDVAIIAMCSPACVSVFRRRPDADAMIAKVLAVIESVKASQTDQWPEEIS